MAYMCMGCLCKGRSTKPESIGKGQVKGFSKNFCSISRHKGKSSLLFHSSSSEGVAMPNHCDVSGPLVAQCKLGGCSLDAWLLLKNYFIHDWSSA